MGRTKPTSPQREDTKIPDPDLLSQESPQIVQPLKKVTFSLEASCLRNEEIANLWKDKSTHHKTKLYSLQNKYDTDISSSTSNVEHFFSLDHDNKVWKIAQDAVLQSQHAHFFQMWSDCDIPWNQVRVCRFTMPTVLNFQSLAVAL